MEKKASNRSQGTQKASTSDSKKSTDVQSSKQFPRSNRKREPTNGFPPKLEPRKPSSQKGKVWDKRPRPRGFYYGNKKENIQMNDEEFESEFGTLLFGGGKKQNLNHLLNFHNEPRGASAPVPRSTTYNLSTRSLMSTHAHKYNKEQFLQANCQFVVRFDGDYGCYLGDPDLLVDWNLVELIRVESCDVVTCPICLYPPVAGKITRCGHIYCWTCILHYLALSDKTWRKCPICYESIHRKDLKSVDTVDRTVFSMGQEITLQLMKREKGSLTAAPVDQFEARMSKNILEFKEKEIDTVYSKLLLAQKDDIEDIIQKEYDQLQTQVAEFSGCPEICFVDEAMEYLKQRKAVLESGVSLAKGASSDEILQGPGTDSNGDDLEEPPTPMPDEPAIANNVGVEDLDIENLAVSQPTKNFYFYQSKDGQHIYLHSINVRMLEMMYGGLDNCPSTIKGKIVEKESGSMTGELRKRLRYMMHIPITCQFEVVEIELLPPLVSHDVAIAFHDQIEMRKKRRFKLAKAEKRREKKIEEHERKQFGRGPTPNLHIESHYDFPEYGEFNQSKPPGFNELDKVSEASSRSVSPSRDETYVVPNLDVGIPQFSDVSQEECGMSFAKMLREGKTLMSTTSAWPTVGEMGLAKDVAGGSTGGSWVQPRRQRQASVTVSGESDCENYAMSPPVRSSFNIAEALEAASKMEKDKETSTTTSGKKKKKKPKVLFATGLQCPGN